MRLKHLETADEWEWFASRAHTILGEDTQGILVVDARGNPAAGVVFDTVTPVAMNCHMVIDDPMALRYGLLEAAARHAFVTLRKKRLFGLVPENNARALRLNKHIGWREITRVPDAFADGVGMVVMRMDRDGCRWLKSAEKKMAEQREEAA